LYRPVRLRIDSWAPKKVYKYRLGFQNHRRGYRKAGTSLMKRVTARIFTIRK
jgi:hypothetical protein